MMENSVMLTGTVMLMGAIVYGFAHMSYLRLRSKACVETTVTKYHNNENLTTPCYDCL